MSPRSDRKRVRSVSTPWSRVRALVAGLAATVGLAAAQPLVAGATADPGRRWVTQAVRYPVAVEDVRPAPPYVPRKTRTRGGDVVVRPGRSAAFALEALGIVRVRADGTPWFARVVGAHGANPVEGRALVREPGVPEEPGVWYVRQPPGSSGVWIVGSDQPTRIRVERPAVRHGVLFWERLRDDVVSWIEGGPPPNLSGFDGAAALRSMLLDDAERHRDIVDAARELDRAAFHWRMASAARHLELARSRVYGLYRRVVRTPKGHGREVGFEGTPYFEVAGDRTFTLRLEGPAILEVDFLAVWDEGEAPRDARLEVRSGDWGLAARSAELNPLQVRSSRDGSEAFPQWRDRVDERGRRASGRLQVDVPLFTGTHEYTVRIEGAPGIARFRTTERRRTMGELLTREKTVAGHARIALRHLRDPGDSRATQEIGAANGPQALRLLALLAEITGDAPPTEGGGIDADIVRTRRVGSDLDGAVERVLRTPSDRDSVRLRVDLARAVAANGRDDLAARLVADVAVDSVDDPALLGAIADYHARDGKSGQASMLAWHLLDRYPLESRFRSVLKRRWRRDGRWSRLRPDTPALGAWARERDGKASIRYWPLATPEGAVRFDLPAGPSIGRRVIRLSLRRTGPSRSPALVTVETSGDGTRPEAVSRREVSFVAHRVDPTLHPTAGAPELSGAAEFEIVLPPSVVSVRLRSETEEIVAAAWLRIERREPDVRLASAPAGPLIASTTLPPAAWGAAVTTHDRPVGREIAPPPVGLATAGPWPQPRRDGLATLSVSTVTGWDDPDSIAADIAADARREELRFGWRRNLVRGRIWFGVEAVRRRLSDEARTEGLRLRTHVRDLPFGLRLSARGSVHRQPTTTGTESATRARVSLSRTIGSTADVDWIASGELTVREYSYDGVTGERPGDPLVYTTYGADHPRSLRARVIARWRPLQDALVVGSFRVATNKDGGPDHVALATGLRTLLPRWLGRPYFQLRYRPSWRLNDGERADDFVRHDVTLRLRWSAWTGDHGRVVLDVRNDLYRTDSTRAVSSITVGYDFTAGRGLRDFAPAAEELDPFVEGRLWSD